MEKQSSAEAALCSETVKLIGSKLMLPLTRVCGTARFSQLTLVGTGMLVVVTVSVWVVVVGLAVVCWAVVFCQLVEEEKKGNRDGRRVGGRRY